MLTLFTTAKPFRGHIAIIQRNALKSWTLLHPDVEIILFGDDEGSAEVCREFDLRHEPHVARTRDGAIRLDDMFQRAQALARHDLLCYANCDILLLEDFLTALEQVSKAHPQFLMAGRRWDTNITEPTDFGNRNWQQQMRARVLAKGHRHNARTIDYFAFRKGLYGADTQPLAIGRFWWDHWLIRKALESGVPVVDASRDVLAIHQNHDFSHHAQGWQGIWSSEDARRNRQILGGWRGARTLADATQKLRLGRLRNNPTRHWAPLMRRAQVFGWAAQRLLIYRLWLPLWHSLLGVTRPLRHALGLRSKGPR